MSHARAVIAGGLLVLVSILAIRSQGTEAPMEQALAGLVLIVVIIVLLLDVDLAAAVSRWRNRGK